MAHSSQVSVAIMAPKKYLFVRLLVVTGLMLALFLARSHPASAATGACTQPTPDYGNVTGLSTPSSFSAGTYRIWTRMVAPDTNTPASGNTYMLEIDGNSCYTIGGSTVPTYTAAQATANNYFSADPTNRTDWISTTNAGTQMDIPLAAGAHTFKLIGNAPNVVVDRVVLTQDTTCPIQGKGDNCANPPDLIGPQPVDITAPTGGATQGAPATVTSPATVNVSATDDSGVVARVELYVDDSSTPITDGTAPFSFSLPLAVGPHHFYAVAYDPSGNPGQSTTTYVRVSDTTIPSTPNIALSPATQPSSGTINLTATATDNVGVTRMTFAIDSAAPVDGTVTGTTTFTGTKSLDTTTLGNASHTLKVVAYDALNNPSAQATLNFTVNNVTAPTDTTKPIVNVLTPSPNAIVAGKPYSVTATATDTQSSIKQVVFTVDGVAKAPVTGTGSPSLSLDTTTLQPGPHTISVVATDNSTNQNVSTTVSVNFRITDIRDANRDCYIDIFDVAAIIPKRNQTATAGLKNLDVNNDGYIDIFDVAAIIPKRNQTAC